MHYGAGRSTEGERPPRSLFDILNIIQDECEPPNPTSFSTWGRNAGVIARSLDGLYADVFSINEMSNQGSGMNRQEQRSSNQQEDRDAAKMFDDVQWFLAICAALEDSASEGSPRSIRVLNPVDPP